jgi:Glycerol-3-phosphate responsive antiterminator (mRNA-binding)
MHDFLEVLKRKPIVAALCKESDLDDLCLSNVKMAVVLCGNIRTIPDIVKRIRDAKIYPFIHIDFIDGLSTSGAAVDFVKCYTCADGIVTTKVNQIKRANELKLASIHRFFVWDRISQDNIEHQMAQTHADVVEVLPGVIPSVIEGLSQKKKIPLIAGGFVNTQKDVELALQNGADAVTTSIVNLWFI